MTPLPGVDALLDHGDIFLVDQFGTLHDGIRPYPGALEGLRLLRAAGTRVALVSNSGKRAAPNQARLSRLGFPPDSFDVLLSSGEVAWQHLAQEGGAGRRCLVLNRGDDDGFLDGLDWRAADRAEDADLVLIAGSEADRRSLESYRALLAPAASRQVPCLCTNPDRTMLVPGGTAPGAGQIAALYADMGGPVTWIGKPYPAIYAATLKALGAAAGPRVIGVGDSVEHDVVGAHAAGCRAALVLTGIAAGLEEAGIAAETARWHASPELVLSRFAV
ncbi:MAG: TIGR01459 family HAD-type hydrolase [Pseudomonadota bacterium]|nr:TIGR01459 family HAD-type hydrolase [Pseudomonadota bacterium]